MLDYRHSKQDFHPLGLLYYQVIALGGPQPQSIVQFGVLDDKVTSVSSSGLLTALSLGTTKVVGKAVGLDPISGESVIYSQVRQILYSGFDVNLFKMFFS